MQKIRIVIADNHELVRLGIAQTLAGSEVEVVGQAATGPQTVQIVEETKPDVLLLDVRMPEVDGLDSLEKIMVTNPNLKVVILTTFDNQTYRARAAALGASVYMLKDVDREGLLDGIRRAMSGEKPLRIELQRMTARGSMGNLNVGDVSLTQREAQVLCHLALGLSNREVGKALGISVDTVKEHVQNMLRKIRVTDRTQAAVWAVKNGLV